MEMWNSVAMRRRSPISTTKFDDCKSSALARLCQARCPRRMPFHAMNVAIMRSRRGSVAKGRQFDDVRSRSGRVAVAMRRRALEQHRVAVAEEAIARSDRVRVRRADSVYASERRHQHQQRRAWQMEIGEQAVDDTEAIARRDKERGLGAARAHGTVDGGSGFKSAPRG